MFLLPALFFSLAIAFGNSPLKDNFTTGNPEVKAINAMTFGPEGILFIGDSKSAQLVALDLSGHEKADHSELRIDRLDELLAEMLGTKVDEIQITDLAVNPENNNIYLGVHHSSGTPLLFRVNGKALEPVSLETISYSKTLLENPVAETAEDRRGRKLRRWAVADMYYSDGKLMVSGLSNKEFASTFRSVNFPFSERQDYGSLEIYHAAHAQYETHAPIKSFIATQVNGKEHLIAGYTCTPLVVFPVDQIKPGEHFKGRTIAELGSGNTPVDMIEIEKEGKRYLLIANSNRPLMKVTFDDLETYSDSLTDPVTEKGGIAGVHHVTLPYVNVHQLDKIGDSGYVMIQRESNGNLALKLGGPWWL